MASSLTPRAQACGSAFVRVAGSEQSGHAGFAQYLQKLLAEPLQLKKVLEKIKSPADSFEKLRNLEQLYLFLKFSGRADLEAKFLEGLRSSQSSGDERALTALILAQDHINKTGNSDFDWQIWSALLSSLSQVSSDAVYAELSYFLIGRDYEKAYKTVLENAYSSENMGTLGQQYTNEFVDKTSANLEADIIMGVFQAQRRLSAVSVEGAHTAYEQGRHLLLEYDNEGVFVYQAFNEDIAVWALANQSFGHGFRTDRMTWLKPSFAWLVRRSDLGKRKNQERILRIKIPHELFLDLMSSASDTQDTSQVKSEKDVLVQWDPDRDFTGNELPRRTIHMGVRNQESKNYIDSIISVEDVTDQVKALRTNPAVNASALEAKHPLRVYDRIDGNTTRKLNLVGGSNSSD